MCWMLQLDAYVLDVSKWMLMCWMLLLDAYVLDVAAGCLCVGCCSWMLI